MVATAGGDCEKSHYGESVSLSARVTELLDIVMSSLTNVLPQVRTASKLETPTYNEPPMIPFQGEMGFKGEKEKSMIFTVYLTVLSQQRPMQILVHTASYGFPFTQVVKCILSTCLWRPQGK
jgi:hypothetical protein